jgi:hypothetical protein
MSPGVRPEKGHLIPKVKMANEIVCDHVWDKLYPPHTIFVTFSKWYRRQALCPADSAFGCNLLSPA